MTLPLTGYSHTDGYLDTQASSGDILSGMAKSALGNVAGGLFSGAVNFAFQENQLENQKELQDRAARINSEAVQQQARLQAAGLRNAGLSSAPVQGAGAPSLQAGAAAGASSQMSNIFSGLADLVAAIKAPSEVEKNLSEANLANAGAKEVGTRVEQYDDYNKFIRDNGPEVVRERIEALKSATISTSSDGEPVSVWDQLSDKTKATLEGIADGTIPLSVGAFRALMDDVTAQRDISDADFQTLASAFRSGLLYAQMNDPKVWDALVKDPENALKNMKVSWSTQAAERKLMGEQGATLVKQRQKMDADIEDIQSKILERAFQMEETELHDIHRLWNDGRYGDVLKRFGINATQEALDVVKAVLPAILLKRGLTGVKVETGKPPLPSLGGSTESGVLRPAYGDKFRIKTPDNIMYRNFR